MWLFQKPSTTKLVLNGVCGGGKQGRGSVLDKRAFLEQARLATTQALQSQVGLYDCTFIAV